MAIVGIARAFEIDFTPYLSASGVKRYNDMMTASIVNVLGQYPGLRWTDLASPVYPTPESLPLYVTQANKLIMGTGGTPTIRCSSVRVLSGSWRVPRATRRASAQATA